MITLTREEKAKFLEWLVQEAEIESALVKQMEKINTAAVFISRSRNIALACRIVATRLQPGEEVVVGAADVGGEVNP